MFEQYKHNDRVAIVGFAPTSRHMAPYNDPTWDLWGLNEASQLTDLDKDGWWKGGETAWFQIHPKWDFMRKHNRNDRNHWKWLQTRDPSIPIFMQHNFSDVPGAVRYPIESVIDLVGQYLTSSASYMIALAILMEYKEIALFGFEMSHDSEYRYQKPGAEYLLGFAKGRGIKVSLPPECSLLRGNLYGYEDMRAADRTYLGMLQRKTEEDLKRDLEVQHRSAGQIDFINAVLEDPKAEIPVKNYVALKIHEVVEAYRVASCQYAYSRGLVDRSKEYIEWHDSQNIPDDRPVLDFRSEEEKNVQAKS